MPKRPVSQHGEQPVRNGHPPEINGYDAPFMVSAPGKVIVFGEHAVVHGKVRIDVSLESN